MLYKYPQSAFPYHDLVETNRRRGREAPEYELIDTGIFDEDRYFDDVVEYAKAGPDDLLVRISATNHGPEVADLHLLPHLWFRNTWSWASHDDPSPRPLLRRGGDDGSVAVVAQHPELGRYVLSCDGSPTLLFTENETNNERLFEAANRTPYVKDGIHERVVNGYSAAVNPAEIGTKAAAWYRLTVQPGATEEIRLRLAMAEPGTGTTQSRPEVKHLPKHARAVAGSQIDGKTGRDDDGNDRSAMLAIMAAPPLHRNAVGTSAQPMFAPRSGGGPMVGMMEGAGGGGLPSTPSSPRAGPRPTRSTPRSSRRS